MMTSTTEPILSEVHVTDVVVPMAVDEAGYRSLADYRREIMPHLAPDMLAPNSGRLVGYGLCATGSIAGFMAIAFLNPVWEVKLVLALVIGFCNGTLGFICHELLHGSVTKNKKLEAVLGFFGVMPFIISPTYWKHSHNRLHHGKTQATIRDPDAFPTLRIYKSSKFVQFMYPFTPGSGHKRSALYFFFWFSFHNLVAQFYLRFRNRIFDPMNHKRVTLELIGQLALVGTLLAIAGPSNWLWVFIIPLAIQNYMLMSYISTNHNLSPLTSENDPLVNSLSVTNHPVLEFLNLNFGYHIEHHIFPTVSGKHTKKIHEVIAAKFPDSYKIMPKGEAMKRLYQTARIYKDSTHLIHPESLELFDTI